MRPRGEDELEAHLQLAEGAALVEQGFDGVFDGILLLTKGSPHQGVDPASSRMVTTSRKKPPRAILPLVQSLQYFIFWCVVISASGPADRGEQGLPGLYRMGPSRAV